MGTVGVAVAGSLAAGVAGANPALAATSGGAPATGRPGDTVFEFVCRIQQTGPHFDGQGYLTDVAGLNPTTLFTANTRDQAHARYLLTAKGSLITRSVEDVVHTLNMAGSLAIFYRPAGDGSSSNPSGSPIATYDLELQDVLTVILPATGIPTLSGVATQRGGGTQVGGRPFGRAGMTARFTATGIGSRSDTGPVDGALAALTVAGSMIAT